MNNPPYIAHPPTSPQRDAQIAALEAEVQAASAAYDSTIDLFKAKMAAAHLPLQELGFPLASAKDLVFMNVKV